MTFTLTCNLGTVLRGPAREANPTGAEFSFRLTILLPWNVTGGRLSNVSRTNHYLCTANPFNGARIIRMMPEEGVLILRMRVTLAWRPLAMEHPDIRCTKSDVHTHDSRPDIRKSQPPHLHSCTHTPHPLSNDGYIWPCRRDARIPARDAKEARRVYRNKEVPRRARDSSMVQEGDWRAQASSERAV